MKQFRNSRFAYPPPQRDRRKIRIWRRTILAVSLALGLLAVPSEAQQSGKRYRIGGLGGVAPATPVYERDWGRGFTEVLSASGYHAGRDFVLEYRWTDAPWKDASAQAAELASRRVDLIVSVGNLRTRAAKEATTTIPIVMVYGFDPVEFGLVPNLVKPGGNVTGFTFTGGPEMTGKQLELLKEAVPTIVRVAVLWAGATFFSSDYLRQIESAARGLGLTLQFHEVRDPDEIEGAFAAMTKTRAQALFLPPSQLNFTHARRIADLSVKGRLPTMHGFREAVESGGLMAYAADSRAMYGRAATYADKIFKGAKPGDLPIEQPTKFDLVINQRTAKALGLTIPQSLLIRTDEVIE
jgi:putative ABC transport system substrate-binding protein